MHLGLIGCGNIAQSLLELLGKDPVQRLTILVREAHRHRAEAAVDGVSACGAFDVVTSVTDLLRADPDISVECAGQQAVAELVPALLENGVPTIVASVGALADRAIASRIDEAAERGGAQFVVPAGAIGGIDILSALAPSGALTVTYRGIKPPLAWMGTPAEELLDLEKIDAPVVFFQGTARDAALTYPKNANVAATLALAGAGFEKTKVELIADPGAAGNIHAYEVRSPICRYSLEIENTASGGNAKTSITTVYSIYREINRFRRSMVI